MEARRQRGAGALRRWAAWRPVVCKTARRWKSLLSPRRQRGSTGTSGTAVPCPGHKTGLLSYRPCEPLRVGSSAASGVVFGGGCCRRRCRRSCLRRPSRSGAARAAPAGLAAEALSGLAAGAPSGRHFARRVGPCTSRKHFGGDSWSCLHPLSYIPAWTRPTGHGACREPFAVRPEGSQLPFAC